uniref:Uncharacterized protein n=1 Tax=Solanum lycopersicum TaxID=4081 RepID=K4B4U2_SOLLC
MTVFLPFPAIFEIIVLLSLYLFVVVFALENLEQNLVYYQNIASLFAIFYCDITVMPQTPTLLLVNVLNWLIKI